MSLLSSKMLTAGNIVTLITILSSFLSGFVLLYQIIKNVHPKIKQKNISIRIPKFLLIFLYLLVLYLIIIVPITTLFSCFFNTILLNTKYNYDIILKRTKFINFISSILLIIVLISLIIIHLSRLLLLRIQYGINDYTFRLHLGKLSWTQYQNKWEILLQENTNYTKPMYVLKHISLRWIISLNIIIIIVLLFVDEIIIFYIISCLLMILSIFGLKLVSKQIKLYMKKSDKNSENNSLKRERNNDVFNIKREMVQVSIILFVISFCMCLLYILFYVNIYH